MTVFGVVGIGVGQLNVTIIGLLHAFTSWFAFSMSGLINSDSQDASCPALIFGANFSHARFDACLCFPVVVRW